MRRECNSLTIEQAALKPDRIDMRVFDCGNLLRYAKAVIYQRVFDSIKTKLTKLKVAGFTTAYLI